MTDPLSRPFLTAAMAYLSARKPTLAIEHAFIVAVLELVARKSGMTATIRIGDGLITRNGEAR
ncbi:DNA-binding phage protein [Caballeronia udeis]|uniref:DNA-binding phage protein n=1 Tax=Caballeronia udeis TaxID=1232866 RepID=A0ABW8MPG5_9BURK